MKSTEMRDLFGAFEEATSITVGLVAIPVVLLILGVFLDKTLGTIPLFIFLGIMGGIVIGIYRAYSISKNYKKTVKMEDKK
jgi:F0F1-type ATP synthase assembly protein I